MAGFKKRTSAAEASRLVEMATRLAGELPSDPELGATAAPPAVASVTGDTPGRAAMAADAVDMSSLPQDGLPVGTPASATAPAPKANLSPGKVLPTGPLATSAIPGPSAHAAAPSDDRAGASDAPHGVGAAPSAVSAGQLLDIALADLRENPWNARRIISQAKVDEYARSMREIGQLTPAAAFVDGKGRITLIDGHCRLRAAIAAGLSTLRVEIQTAPATDLDLYLRSRKMNVERAEQTAIDDALAWRLLLERKVFPSQAAIAAAVGLSEGAVSKTLALAELPQAVIAAVTEQPELMTLRVLYEVHLFCRQRGDEETLSLIAEAGKRGLSARDIEARRRTAEKGPQHRPRSVRRPFVIGQAKGEIRRFDADGRLELVVAGLAPDTLGRLEDQIAALVAQVSAESTLNRAHGARPSGSAKAAAAKV